MWRSKRRSTPQLRIGPSPAAGARPLLPPVPPRRRAPAGAQGRSRQERLAGAGRPDEQQTMAAGKCDLQAAARFRLASYLNQVREAESIARHGRWAQGSLDRSPGCLHELDSRRGCGEMVSPARSHQFDRVAQRQKCTPSARRLVDRRGRDDDPPDTPPDQRGHHRQDARHRPNLAAERQLADPKRAAGTRSDLLRRASPRAMARSSEAPALRRSAGARLTVIRRGGWTYPAFRNAPRTRSRASCSAASARPTIVKPGSPGRRRPRPGSAGRRGHGASRMGRWPARSAGYGASLTCQSSATHCRLTRRRGISGRRPPMSTRRPACRPFGRTAGPIRRAPNRPCRT